MLTIVEKMGKLPFRDLMEVYAGSNAEMAAEQWPDLPPMEALMRAELDFYQYLRHDFFTTDNAFYALWMEKGKVVSALRLEPWRQGWLLEGLETRPDCRGKGYAQKLMAAALESLSGRVYAHVKRDNRASLAVHRKCGFVLTKDTAMVDGSYLSGFVTMVREE